MTVMDDPAKRTNDDNELLVDAQEIVNNWRREAVQEGIMQGEKRGLRRALLMLYEARLGGMPQELREIVEATEDEATLVAWVQIVGTREAEEIAAALRATIG